MYLRLVNKITMPTRLNDQLCGNTVARAVMIAVTSVPIAGLLGENHYIQLTNGRNIYKTSVLLIYVMTDLEVIIKTSLMINNKVITTKKTS